MCSCFCETFCCFLLRSQLSCTPSASKTLNNRNRSFEIGRTNPTRIAEPYVITHILLWRMGWATLPPECIVRTCSTTERHLNLPAIITTTSTTFNRSWSIPRSIWQITSYRDLSITGNPLQIRHIMKTLIPVQVSGSPQYIMFSGEAYATSSVLDHAFCWNM